MNDEIETTEVEHTIPVILGLVELKIGAQRWKPYEITVTGSDYIRIEVPSDYWTADENEEDIVLTLGGVAYIAKEIADTFEKVHNDRANEIAVTVEPKKFMKTSA